MTGCREHRTYQRGCRKCRKNARRHRNEADLVRIPWSEGDTATDISHCVAMLKDEIVNKRLIYGATHQPDWMEAMLVAATREGPQ